MTNWYKKTILPRLINTGMDSPELEAIRRTVLMDASGVVLEIGIGPGHNIPLYRDISKLYALEPSKELIAIAKSRVPGPFFVEFLHTGAESIPLPDQSVDTVVSTWTLCSVNDPEKVLKELARVLRPDGRFIFVEHGACSTPFLHTVQTALTFVTKHFTGNCHYDRSMEKLIREAGFKIQKMEHPKKRYKPLMYNYQGYALR